MTDAFRSLYTRQREFEARVNTELTEASRHRLASITDIHHRISENAFSELQNEIGAGRLLKSADELEHIPFIMTADTVLVLSYLEHLINISHNQAFNRTGSRVSKSKIREIVTKTKDVLITEGLLWELNFEGNITFQPIESEAMAEIDKEVQALAETEPWNDALQGYNAAFERYLSGDFDELIPKKLYNSIEGVLQTICVDLEGWTDNRDLSHSDYLKMLNDNSVYDANGITAPELNGLVDGLEKLVNKVGNDRKQRHQYIDRTYCTLLIHQTGAYLYFLINRYESFAGMSN